MFERRLHRPREDAPPVSCGILPSAVAAGETLGYVLGQPQLQLVATPAAFTKVEGVDRFERTYALITATLVNPDCFSFIVHLNGDWWRWSGFAETWDSANDKQFKVRSFAAPQITLMRPIEVKRVGLLYNDAMLASKPMRAWIRKGDSFRITYDLCLEQPAIS